jgi:AcrR family transcriptional regulator
MSGRRVPVSRRDRPAKAPLSRAVVVGAALAIMRADGLEKVTMRRLADELDTGPASLYVYVDNMAELHGAILDELLAELSFETGAPGQWREQLVDLLSRYTTLLFQYPGLARSVLSLWPSGPHYLRLIDTLLGLLDAGLVPAQQAAWGVNVLLQHATSTAAEHGTRAENKTSPTALTTAVDDVDAQRYPHIARTAAALWSGTGPQRQQWAFNALIDGITSTPVPE